MTAIPDEDVDLDDLQLEHEFRVLVVTAAKLKAKIHNRLSYHRRSTYGLEKRAIEIDGFLTRAERE